MFRVGENSDLYFVQLILLLNPPILETHVHKQPPPPAHIHTLGRMTAQLGCVREARAGAVWSLCMWECGRICEEVWAVCVFLHACVCVCGPGVWSLARAWGEPADGWDEKRAAVFTLLWGLCMDTGTLPRPLSITLACTNTHVHKSHVTHHHKNPANQGTETITS